MRPTGGGTTVDRHLRRPLLAFGLWALASWSGCQCESQLSPNGGAAGVCIATLQSCSGDAVCCDVSETCTSGLCCVPSGLVPYSGEASDCCSSALDTSGKCKQEIESTNGPGTGPAGSGSGNSGGNGATGASGAAAASSSGGSGAGGGTAGGGAATTTSGGGAVNGTTNGHYGALATSTTGGGAANGTTNGSYKVQCAQDEQTACNPDVEGCCDPAAACQYDINGNVTCCVADGRQPNGTGAWACCSQSGADGYGNCVPPASSTNPSDPGITILNNPFGNTYYGNKACAATQTTCQLGQSCCDSSSTCSTDPYGNPVCCVTNYNRPSSGNSGNCCSQNGTDLTGACIPYGQSFPPSGAVTPPPGSTVTPSGHVTVPPGTPTVSPPPCGAFKSPCAGPSACCQAPTQCLPDAAGQSVCCTPNGAVAADLTVASCCTGQINPTSHNCGPPTTPPASCIPDGQSASAGTCCSGDGNAVNGVCCQVAGKSPANSASSGCCSKAFNADGQTCAGTASASCTALGGAPSSGQCCNDRTGSQLAVGAAGTCCIDNGKAPDATEGVSSCCSGVAGSDGNCCQQDGTPLPPGESASACCSQGSADGKTCNSSQCTPTGAVCNGVTTCCDKSITPGLACNGDANNSPAICCVADWKQASLNTECCSLNPDSANVNGDQTVICHPPDVAPSGACQSGGQTKVSGATCAQNDCCPTNESCDAVLNKCCVPDCGVPINGQVGTCCHGSFNTCQGLLGCWGGYTTACGPALAPSGLANFCGTPPPPPPPPPAVGTTCNLDTDCNLHKQHTGLVCSTLSGNSNSCQTGCHTPSDCVNPSYSCKFVSFTANVTTNDYVVGTCCNPATDEACGAP